jgi:MFS family permease
MTETPALPAPPVVAKRVLLIVTVAVFLDMTAFGVVIPLLPLYVQSMGGAPEHVGAIISGFAVMQLVATPLLGRLADRFGRRPVILVSLGGNAVSMALTALAIEVRLLPLLIGARLLAGATAGNISACQAVAADVTTEDERAPAMGRIGAAIGLGLVLGPVLGSLASTAAAVVPVLVAAILVAADFAAALFWMPETRFHRTPLPGASPYRAPGVESPLGALRRSMGHHALGPVLAIIFLVFLVLSCVQVCMPLLAYERFGWSGSMVSALFALIGLIGLVVQGGLIGPLSRRWQPRSLVIAGAVILACAMVLLSQAREPWGLIAGVALFSAGFGVANPLLSALASQYADPERRGTVLGVAQSAGGLARVFGPVASGLLFALRGPGMPFLAAGAAAVLAAAVGLRLRLLPR